MLDSFNLLDEDSEPTIINEDAVNDLIAENTQDFVDEDTVRELITESTRDFVDAAAVNSMIETATKDFVNETEVKALIAEETASSGSSSAPSSGLTTEDVNSLIDARNYVNEATVNSLITNGTQDFVNEDTVKALIAECAAGAGSSSSSSWCNCGLKEDEVNALIDARNYVNEATVSSLITEGTKNFLDETAIKALIAEETTSSSTTSGGLTEDEVNTLIENRIIKIRSFKDTYFSEYVIDLALSVVNERVKATALN